MLLCFKSLIKITYNFSKICNSIDFNLYFPENLAKNSPVRTIFASDNLILLQDFQYLMKKNILPALFLLLTACTTPEKKISLQPGIWRATVLTSGGELPFGLEISKQNDTSFQVFALNGKERLPLDNARFVGDSVRIPMELFESEIVAKIEAGKLIGRFTKFNLTQSTTLPFQATLGETYRFKTANTAASPFAGTWETFFFSGKDTSRAIGVFEQTGNSLSGTFLTPTGDYRYLAGNAVNDSLFLSCFDGTHLYLFKARMAGDSLTGGFWSGKSGYKPWKAVRNEKARLPDASTLTYLKKGFDKLTFTFPDTAGKPVSLTEERFRNKVVILQIMGSWCPNCMDETRFLAPWYKRNKDKGVEVIGLAYEKSPEAAVSVPKLKKMITRFGIAYPVLLAGTNAKGEADKTLPMLNRIVGYPTTIFIDRQGKVRHIHTGFSGPGTGKYYEEWTEDFEKLTTKLLSEKGN